MAPSSTLSFQSASLSRFSHEKNVAVFFGTSISSTSFLFQKKFEKLQGFARDHLFFQSAGRFSSSAATPSVKSLPEMVIVWLATSKAMMLSIEGTSML